jgi:hypothetical protein
MSYYSLKNKDKLWLKEALIKEALEVLAEDQGILLQDSKIPTKQKEAHSYISEEVKYYEPKQT